MAYRMAATVVTLNDFQGYSPVAGLFKCKPSNIYAPTRSLAEKFSYLKRVLGSIEMCVKFRLSSSSSFRDMMGSQI